MLSRTRNFTKKHPFITTAGLLFVFSKGYLLMHKSQSAPEESPKAIYYYGKTNLTAENPDTFLKYDIEKETDVNDINEYSTQYLQVQNVPRNLIGGSCGPIAAFEIMEYWTNNGYPNLASGNKKDEYIEICNSLQFYEGKGTAVINISPGLLNYTSSKNYDFKSNIYTSDDTSKKDIWDITVEQTRGKKPVIAAIPVYDSKNVNHAVVIVGTCEFDTSNIFSNKRYLKLLDSFDASKISYLDFDKIDDIGIITLEPQK